MYIHIYIYVSVYIYICAYVICICICTYFLSSIYPCSLPLSLSVCIYIYMYIYTWLCPYMTFGRVWQHAKYSYGEWESFDPQANIILRTFRNHPQSTSESNCLTSPDFGPTKPNIFLLPARTPASVCVCVCVCLIGSQMWAWGWKVCVCVLVCVAVCVRCTMGARCLNGLQVDFLPL